MMIWRDFSLVFNLMVWLYFIWRIFWTLLKISKLDTLFSRIFVVGRKFKCWSSCNNSLWLSSLCARSRMLFEHSFWKRRLYDACHFAHFRTLSDEAKDLSSSLVVVEIRKRSLKAHLIDFWCIINEVLCEFLMWSLLASYVMMSKHVGGPL